MLRMIRSFLPVGQGAFYCESFSQKNTHDNINIVYDCGSQTDVKIVELEIRNNFRYGETIDALFISHLHEDHVNGIPYLLAHCNVKRIYFPLITSKNRKLMEIYYHVNNIDGFPLDFFRDPYETVRNLSPDNTPVLNGIDEADNEDESIDWQQDRLRRQRSGDNVFEDIKASYHLKNTAYDKWLYIPFNFRQTARVQSLLNNLQGQFQRTITEDEMVRLWENNNPGDRDKIKQAYAKVPGGFNVNSMTLFSGEIGDTLSQYKRGCCSIPYFPGCKSPGCLYMGDYDASGTMKWKDLQKAYQRYWQHIGGVQIPHHGSHHNFNPDFLRMDAFFIISAGYTNRYHHPHASVVKAFLLKGIMPHIVTEQAGSAAHFVIF